MKKPLPTGAIKRARSLRSNMTDAEQAMWAILRTHFPDWRFRRQVPLGPYIADFASHRARLVIEVDGGQHDAAIDERRTAFIEGEGYRVLRFWNHEVLGNGEGVAEKVGAELGDMSPPSKLR